MSEIMTRSDQPRGVGRADAGGRGRNVLDQGRREIGIRPYAGRPPCRGLRRAPEPWWHRQRSAKRRWPGPRRCTGPRSTCRRRRSGQVTEVRRAVHAGQGHDATATRFSVAVAAKPEHTLTVKVTEQRTARRRSTASKSGSARFTPAPTRPAAPSCASARASISFSSGAPRISRRRSRSDRRRRQRRADDGACAGGAPRRALGAVSDAAAEVELQPSASWGGSASRRVRCERGGVSFGKRVPTPLLATRATLPPGEVKRARCAMKTGAPYSAATRAASDRPPRPWRRRT